MADLPFELGVDDERFDDLYDKMEALLQLYFKEVLEEQGIHGRDDEINEEAETALNFFAVILAAFDAQIMGTSQDQNSNELFDIRLTVPTGDLREVIRRTREILESDPS